MRLPASCLRTAVLALALLSALLSTACRQASAGPLRPHPRLFLPLLGAAAARRFAANGPGAQALTRFCEGHANVPVRWPDEGGDTDPHRIATGYQGSDYAFSLGNLGLCWQLTKKPAYAKKGVEVLVKMSEPQGPHAPNPLADGGYGIRFYGFGMALGYDWLYDAMTPAERQRVWEALNRWVEAYDAKGFENDHPVGNYYAGYYVAKAMAALATEGDNPKAPAMWEAWERTHRKLVQPYFAKNLTGGGWPEGWNYGPLATMNMAWAALAAQSAKGIDLVRDFRFPIEQAYQLIHFSWPSRRTMDDRGAQHASENPSKTNPSLVTVLAGLVELWRDPIAPAFHRYAREVRQLIASDPASAWEDLLFWEPAASEAELGSVPLSFLSPGMNTAAMRSSWANDAVWASFTAGTYVTNVGAGEMYFDQGSFAIVRGGRPLVANAVGWLSRNTPGTNDGDKVYDAIYDDLFGNHDKDPRQMNRTIFNIFYVRSPHYGQVALGPEQAKTRTDRFEDGGGYVVVRGTRLEEMYRQPHGQPRPVARWTRQLTYLRPQLFVIDDRTAAADEHADQWLAFHFAGALAPQGGRRWNVAAGGKPLGSVTTVLPAGARGQVVDLFDRHKVYRLELRPAQPSAEQRWLTVVDAADKPEELVASTPLSARDGSVEAGEVLGVLLTGRSGQWVVLSGARGADDAVSGEIRYRVPQSGATAHVLADLPAGAAYSISVSGDGKRQVIRLLPGGPYKASARGILAFRTDGAGAVTAGVTAASAPH
jgi:hypothetical protein